MNRLLTLPLLTGLIGIGSPFMATAVEAPSELQEMLRGIDGMRRLPVQGIQMVWTLQSLGPCTGLYWLVLSLLLMLGFCLTRRRALGDRWRGSEMNRARDPCSGVRRISQRP